MRVTLDWSGANEVGGVNHKIIFEKSVEIEVDHEKFELEDRCTLRCGACPVPIRWSMRCVLGFKTYFYAD